MAVMPLGLSGDGFAVGHARRAGVHLQPVAARQPVELGLQVNLAHAADHPGMAAVVALQAHRGILGGQPGQRFRELLLVPLPPWRQRQPVHRRRQHAGLQVDVVFVVRVVQHGVEVEFVDACDRADLAGLQAGRFDQFLAVDPVQMRYPDRPAGVADEQLHVLAHRALEHAEGADPAHVRIDRDPEHVRDRMRARIGTGGERLRVRRAGAAPEELRRIGFQRRGGERRDDVQQFGNARAGAGRSEHDRDQAAVAQRLLERCVQLLFSWIGSLVQVARQQGLVVLDQAVDQRTVRAGDGVQVGLAVLVRQELDHFASMARREVEEHAFAAEAFPDLPDHAGEVGTLCVDAVDHDHPAQAALARRAHHAFGHRTHPGARVDHHQRGVGRRQGGDRLPRKIRQARGVGQVEPMTRPFEIDQGGLHRMAELALERVVVADRVALLDASRGRQRAGRGEERLRQRGLPGPGLPHQDEVADCAWRGFGHGFVSPVTTPSLDTRTAPLSAAEEKLAARREMGVYCALQSIQAVYLAVPKRRPFRGAPRLFPSYVSCPFAPPGSIPNTGFDPINQLISGNVAMSGTTQTGIVKWFNESKGFGFISPDGGGEDLFAHFSEIQGSGFKTLAEAQRVQFEVKRGPKGLQAAAIRPL